MDEYYEVEGQAYQVPPEKLEQFLLEFPNAVKTGTVQNQQSEEVVVDSEVNIDNQIDFDETLPQTEMFDVDQREGRVVDILKRKYGGLNFKFEETVAGRDYVKIIAPNDAEQEFEVDLDK